MPGIIPMKLIKTGNANQVRVAQACDRCRSKKIRCDGIRPSCSQCASVGFQCKTSDKLSRRAFPRGYTESLEERVRSLEQEVNELKSLLDAKEEQIDVLSRLHSFSPYSPATSLSSASPKRPVTNHALSCSESSGPSLAEESCSDDTFSMPESTSLVHDGKSGEFFTGASSGRAFIDTFKSRMKESSPCDIEFSGNTFFTRREKIVKVFPHRSAAHAVKPPPRMISDLLVTAFFQEYHPLFPILHRPKFLSIYDNLINCEPESPEYPREYHEIAQLFLVFSIASSQSETRNTAEHESFTRQWQYALEAIMLEPSLESLQCLVLAQLYCMSIGDDSRLNQYKSLAVGTALRLGLNQDQKKFGLKALQSEMRKRAFWCVYMLDAFSASMTGLPPLLNDNQVEVEYPTDIDDEFVSESGYEPTMPGDHTKISSALALFRGSRILKRVLAVIYASSGEKQSYKKLQELEEELDDWKINLAPHLRLEFVNGMPGTNIVNSRSPLLVFAYHYIRILIHRSTIGSDSNSSTGSVHAVVESSKCMYQIVKLLEERKLGFSFCLNKNQTLLLCTFAILHGATDYSQDGVLVKETQKLVSEMLNTLHKGKYQLVKALSVIAASLFKLDKRVTPPRDTASPPLPVQIRDDVQQLRRAYSVSTTNLAEKPKVRQLQTDTPTISNMSPPSGITFHSNWSRASLPSQNTAGTSPKSLHTPVTPGIDTANNGSDIFNWNLDGIPTPTQAARAAAMSGSDWERMLALMDQNQGINIYGGGPFDTPADAAATLPSPVTDATDRRESSSSRSIYEVLHPTAASVSSLTFSDEDLALPIFDTDASGGYYPELMGGIAMPASSLGLESNWGL